MTLAFVMGTSTVFATSIDDLKNEYFREEFFAADKEQSESFINAFRALLGGNPQEDNYRDTCLKPFLNTIFS